MGQPARRRLDQRDCRSRASSPANPGRTLRRRSCNGRRVRGRSRPVHSLCPLLWRLISKSAAGDRCSRCTGAHRSVLAPMERSLFRCWALDGSGQTLAHHAEGVDLCPDRRNRRRSHHVTSRAPRRREELGLSLLLAAGCRLHASGTDEPRLLRRGAGMARLAYSGIRRQPEPSSDHVRGRERWLPELIVPWLPGYENSAPVRIGNDASKQLQLDVFGEVIDAIFQAFKAGMAPTERGRALRPVVLDYLATAWRQPDEGIWEVRGGRQHFVYSKVMAWVAFDRAASELEAQIYHESGQRWREIADEIHAEVCDRGFDRDLNSFVQAYGSKLLDASLLLIPIVGFLPPEDPRVRGTLRAIEERLLIDGEFVLRYETEHTGDGLPAGEGAFLACSFWLVDNYILQGRDADARKLFARLLSRCNDVGLL